MSVYKREYCPTCKKRTEHEDGFCMPCAEAIAKREIVVEKALGKSGITYDTVVIGRGEDLVWSKMILSGVYMDAPAPFYMMLPNGDAYHVEMIAPLIGNEKLLFTQDTPSELWDFDRMLDY